MSIDMCLYSHVFVQVKIAYVNFVNHCYVDTEVEMKEIYTSNHIWRLFDDFTVDLAQVRGYELLPSIWNSLLLKHKAALFYWTLTRQWILRNITM